MYRLFINLTAICIVLIFAGSAIGQDPDNCENTPGDANDDGVVNAGDFIYLTTFFCSDGPLPEPLANGDYDGDCDIDSLDVAGSFWYLFKCKSPDKCGYPPPAECTCDEPVIGEFYNDRCFGAVPGDANDDGYVQIGDVVYLVAYIFKGGPKPQPFDYISGDANCDCVTDLGDAVFIINYVFQGGPGPCSCEEILDTCEEGAQVFIDWLFFFP